MPQTNSRMAETIIDLGCGPRKTPGAIGVDGYPYAGVDLVADLGRTPWPLADGISDHIMCRHVIEHVADPVSFLREIHRIAKPGALVEITTPHFSARRSWSDPTHKRHLSSRWYEPFCDGGYLAVRTGAFDVVSSAVIFGGSLRSFIPRAIVKLFGQDVWEKHYAFMYPARDVHTTLRVVK